MLTIDRTVRRIKPAAVLAVGAVVGLVSAAVLVSVPAAASPAEKARTTISKPSAFDAPIGRRGGIMNPLVICSNANVEPRVKWTLTNLGTGRSQVFRWRGALPGVHFPRVSVGSYRSVTSATCRGNTTKRTNIAHVEEKTRARTVSRAEFRRVHRGMTRGQVAEAVGFRPSDCSRFGNAVTCQYDMMAFWSWSIVEFRNGRVHQKFWNVGHD